MLPAAIVLQLGVMGDQGSVTTGHLLDGQSPEERVHGRAGLGAGQEGQRRAAQGWA